MAESGFTIVIEETYNYSIDTGNLWNLVKFAPAMLFKEWAEVIFIHSKKNG